jgi:hypothetical protein
MSKRAFWILSGVLLGVVAVQAGVIIWVRLHVRITGIRWTAINAGIPLAPDDGQITVSRAGLRQQAIGQGKLGEVIEAPPGKYDIRVLYSASRDHQEVWTEGISVGSAEQVQGAAEFSAGELAVNASIGRRKAGERQAVVQVVRRGDPDRVIVSLAPGERALLASGKYDVRVVLLEGSQEKAVRWLRDVQVQPGLLNQQEVAFRRGVLLVKSTNAGEQLPASAVSVTVYRAGDLQEEPVDTGSAGQALGLDVGQYDAKVTFTASGDRPFRWLRGLEIGEDTAVERSVNFSSGSVLVRAFITGGEELPPFHAYVYFYRPGDHQQAVAYVPAGQSVTLSQGHYDVRGQFLRSHDHPDIWRRGLQVRPGGATKEALSFASGTLLVRCYDDRGKELLGDNVFVYVHPAGEPLKAVAVARGSEAVVLTAGSYDIRLCDTRGAQREIWVRSVTLKPGKRLERTATFPVN